MGKGVIAPLTQVYSGALSLSEGDVRGAAAEFSESFDAIATEGAGHRLGSLSKSINLPTKVLTRFLVDIYPAKKMGH